MSVIINKWNDGSGDSINIESPSFQGNQTVKISSPVQKGTSKRSMKFIGKCKKDSSKQVILIVEQEASTYTYDLTLNSDNTEIAAKGGTATITAVLKTYRNGNLVSTDNVTPVLSGSATGFSISGTTVTASNRTTTVGDRRGIVVTGKYSNTFDGQTVSSTINIYQEANAVIDDNYNEHLSSYGTPEISIIASQITAAGGTARAAGVVRNTYTYYDLYTSGSTVPYTRTKAGVYKIEMISNGNNRFSMDDTYLITHSSMGTNVTTDTATFRCYNEGDRTKYVDESISVSNRIESYSYGSWNIGIFADPTSLPATGGTSTITSNCIRSKTPVYTSGSTGIATIESATPTLSLTTNPGGFTLSGNKLTAVNNPIGAKTATVTASYSGATSKSVSVTQEASTYTYDLTLNSDNTEIAAKGGTATITAVLKTYRNGNLVSTDNVTPVLSGSATGFSISGTTVTASNRTTTVGDRRGIVVTGKYSNTFDGQTVSSTINIYQEANAVIDDNYNEHLSSYGTPEISIIASQITAAGGTARAAGVVRNTYTYYDLYTSGSTVPYTRTKAGVYKIEMISNGNNRFSMDDTYLITHSSMGTNVTTDTATFRCYNEGDRTKYVDESISVSNRIESYSYGSWNIGIFADPTSLPATGGTSTITSNCIRSKTPVYTSGSTGIATIESATPTLSLTTNPGGFTLSGNKLTAVNNPIGAKTATVTASYSGATSKSVSVTQAAGPDGIGYM